MSAHVETLTQQVAEQRVATENNFDNAVAHLLRAEQAEQENARLTADNESLRGERQQHIGVIDDLSKESDRLEQQRDAALAALKRYGQHRPDCDVVTCRTVTADFCTCGLNKAQGDKS